ncbi:MAG: lipopolysaccharide assembly protein LapB [Rhodocyclaceae bacterium]
MDFELWWLLALPLFFALGWVAARIDIRHVVRESRTLPRSYFQGLNYLLNEQPDRAIEAFIEAVKVDPQTIELHFALGSLFRRRGEFDRAIRMHRNLIEREDLAEADRLAALCELGQDYLKAGLLDRAEETFQKLAGTASEETAQKFLLEVYEQEKDWARAIEIAGRLPDAAGHLRQSEIANFHCEIASREMTHSHPDEARRHLAAAAAIHRKCARANILLGELEAAAGNTEAAIAAWKAIEQQNPAYLALVAQRLMEAHVALGRADRGLQLLRGYLEEHPSVDLLDTLFRAELEANGAQSAYRLVRDELERNPTLLGLDKLLEAQLLVTPPEGRADLDLVKNLIHAHTRRVARYRCSECGFKARQFHWRCPACGGWETYPPRRTEEFDLAP